MIEWLVDLLIGRRHHALAVGQRCVPEAANARGGADCAAAVQALEPALLAAQGWLPAELVMQGGGLVGTVQFVPAWLGPCQRRP